MKAKEMMTLLKAEDIKTWFDLGIFIDRFRENREIPQTDFTGSYSSFKKRLQKGGVSFITYYYAIDGVTIEIQKYTKAYENLMPNIPVHFIAGEIIPGFEKGFGKSYNLFEIPEIKGFDGWPLYQDFYFTKLERGSKTYNELLPKFWNEILVITEKVGTYIEENNIRLLHLVNTNSNPGNVSLAVAVALISEYLGIPVINNNHDFYWEGGNKEIDIKTKNLERGPRDFFFINSHLGEFFSQIDVFFPWESRSWLAVNINKNQSEVLIDTKGHNPANVCEIGTSVDAEEFTTLPKREKIKAFLQVKDILSDYKEKLTIYTIDQILKKIILPDKNEATDFSYVRPFITANNSNTNFDFTNNNIVFLQPTRIIQRKRIEANFMLVNRLFETEEFTEKFDNNPQLNITILVSGPIPYGQFSYLIKLINEFSELLNSVSEIYKDKIYLGFMFSEFDKPSFRKKYQKPIGIPELYNIASLILLPSETEGRGLPVIEAVASGIPIFCRRYYPENVYSELIGEDLPEVDRLRVLEFTNKTLKDKLIKQIISNIFYPQNHVYDIIHNRKVVEKRFSINALQKNIDDVLYRLYLQLWPPYDAEELCINSFEEYDKVISFRNEDFNYLINTEKRHYLPGFGRLKFMMYLKSLIDPSFFRIEEQQVRGMAMEFAKKLIDEHPEPKKIPLELLHTYYNTVDYIFYYQDGKEDIRHDHSMSYRHRNVKYYPYRDYTFQELTGLINMIFNKIFSPPEKPHIDLTPHFFTDWNLALFQLTNSSTLAIDNRACLMRRLKENVPIAYFPGRYMQHELEFFILQPLRAKLKLKIEEELTEEKIKESLHELSAVYIFMHEKSGAKWFSVKTLENYLQTTKDEELKLIYRFRLCKIVKTKQLSVGIHFNQLGEEALNIMTHIKNKNGFIIANGENTTMMTDIVDLDRFHIGRSDNILNSKILGIPNGSGFIQFVPAGVRTTLAYPTPIQTAKDFSDTIKSDLFNELAEEHGEKELFNLISEDAKSNGTPIKLFLENLKNNNRPGKEKGVKTLFVSGIFDDGLPWSGVTAEIKITGNNKKWIFGAENVPHDPKPVTEIVKKFEIKNNIKAQIAWNGGYILNPELVGKLGLPETYIGSPLGLLIMDKKTVSLPLFNKPAFIIYEDGTLDIRRVSSKGGFLIKNHIDEILFSGNYCNKHSVEYPCYYNLMYDEEFIPGDGNVIVRLAGNIVKEIVHTKPEENVKLIPVGVTLSIPKEKFKEETFVLERKLTIIQNNTNEIRWNKISYAIEAGPLLVNDQEKCLDMEIEGWKKNNSIRTQAARLDYTDMRGPKIAVGIDKKGNLHVLMVNGRIRESVGATHHDIADILVSYGMEKAMGFDPGGSSTLVVNGKPMNISPYNSEYEKDIYSLSPEPRAVSNAVIGWTEE